MPIAFVPILPGKFYPEAFKRSLEQELQVYADGVDKDFQKTHQGWSAKSKPKQTVILKVDLQAGCSVEVILDGDIYMFVHDGTAPHKIKPKKKGGKLAFKKGHKSKTKKGQIQSGPGGTFGETIYSEGVNHPGNEGRQFSKVILAKWRPAFKKAVERGLAKGAKESGHYYS